MKQLTACTVATRTPDVVQAQRGDEVDRDWITRIPTRRIAATFDSQYRTLNTMIENFAGGVRWLLDVR